tara:strand:- start:908 stop:1165 length:258 start_codon:yes stop_codon:yes gene_type:complete
LSKDKLPDNVIPFPNIIKRVGKKYRQDEISRIQDMLQLCDEDMQTIVEQIEQLNMELSSLTLEYEKLMERLKNLLEIEENDKNDK